VGLGAVRELAGKVPRVTLRRMTGALQGEPLRVSPVKSGEHEMPRKAAPIGGFVSVTAPSRRRLMVLGVCLRVEVCQKFFAVRSARVPKVNFQVLRRTVATHVQGMGSAKDTQTMLRHTKPDTAQINYVQPVEDSVRSAVDKLAATLLG
jgi:hypothetical protein